MEAQEGQLVAGCNPENRAVSPSPVAKSRRKKRSASGNAAAAEAEAACVLEQSWDEEVVWGQAMAVGTKNGSEAGSPVGWDLRTTERAVGVHRNQTVPDRGRARRV